ncbi:hypothetical protein LTR78_002667 [Recurvomyces mirabilis]|uniref:Uncharacterized protein n=1 Tax=Recurvomyces mirabilis TaxID=574656 RepID=A0AAE1C4G6_9PEZI|nr:hypothetical protein LTR78_002667 [Recurvomyces mirabilis]KAK5157596.1 hypothetical protein LTS14_004361 [Recurvomyces mirabilis]
MATDYARALVRRHPLQRRPSPSRGASALLHVLGLASFAYNFTYLFTNPNPMYGVPIPRVAQRRAGICIMSLIQVQYSNTSYGWHLQYLTIIGLSLAAVTFFIGLLADLTMSRWLFAAKNALSVASAPMECLISMLYWGLRAIDPKLVLPGWTPPMALHTDLGFHAVPAIALVTDLLFFSPPYTIAFVPALGLSGFIAFGYWLWIERCYQYNKFYPYPIFTLLSTTERIG